MYTRSLLILALTFGTTGLATAQEISDTGGRVFGLLGGSFGDGGTTLTTSGGAGLRLTRHLGLDFEVLYVADLYLSDGDDFVIQGGGRRRFPFPSFRIDEDGSLTTFLTKLTVDFPVAGDRVVPYVTGGGGIGRLSRRTEVRFGDDGCFRHQVLLRCDGHVRDRSSGPPARVSEHPHDAQPPDDAPQGHEDVPKRQPPRGKPRLHRRRPRLASELQRPMRPNEVVVAT